MISQKMGSIKSMYTPMYLFGKFANFFLQTLLYVGEHQQGV